MQSKSLSKTYVTPSKTATTNVYLRRASDVNTTHSDSEPIWKLVAAYQRVITVHSQTVLPATLYTATLYLANARQPNATTVATCSRSKIWIPSMASAYPVQWKHSAPMKKGATAVQRTVSSLERSAKTATMQSSKSSRKTLSQLTNQWVMIKVIQVGPCQILSKLSLGFEEWKGRIAVFQSCERLCDRWKVILLKDLDELVDSCASLRFG